jgi:hypothetical protein
MGSQEATRPKAWKDGGGGGRVDGGGCGGNESLGF